MDAVWHPRRQVVAGNCGADGGQQVPGNSARGMVGYFTLPAAEMND